MTDVALETKDVTDSTEEQTTEDETQVPAELSEVVMKEEFGEPVLYVVRYYSTKRNYDSRNGKVVGIARPEEIVMILGISEYQNILQFYSTTNLQKYNHTILRLYNTTIIQLYNKKADNHATNKNCRNKNRNTVAYKRPNSPI